MGFLLQGQEPPKLDPLKTSITVVETVDAEAPANLTITAGEELRLIPGTNLDTRLRQVPGFSLFRRFSSVAAHPTTQGVSLRGIGPTGASRTLVRWDGVPVNDPFGGWVQWTRFAPLEMDRVEISRGASTSVFGDRAMGGAISMFSTPQDRTRLHGGYEFGNRNTHEAGAGGVWLGRRWAGSANARAFTTNGYFVVPEPDRGTIDREVELRFVAGDARLDVLGAANRFFTKFDFLTEERGNGTVAQRNSTTLGNIAGHFSREGARDGFSLLGYHTREEFRNAFSAVAPDRNSERVTTLQRVPATASGGAGFWRHRRSRFQALIGGDVHRVEGFSNDLVVFTGFRRRAGGDLLQHGYFAQLDGSIGPLRLFAGSRYHFADQGRRFFSPSGGAVAGRGMWRIRGSVYRSFRVPTLNELYRPFRVGNVATAPNENLQPESLFGAEVGVDVIGETRRLSLTGYRNELKDLITNVTLGVSPELINRQRQNAGTALARGFEAEVRQRWRAVTLTAGYLFVDSRFEEGPRVPQVPKHQGSAQVTYNRGSTLLTGGLRAYSFQFEDDLNSFLLPGYPVLHFQWLQRLKWRLSLLASVENTLDREFVVGFNPTRIGAPRLWRVGLRWGGP